MSDSQKGNTRNRKVHRGKAPALLVFQPLPELTPKESPFAATPRINALESNPMKTLRLGFLATLLSALTSFAAPTASLPAAAYIIDHRHSPHAQLRPLPFDAVQWTDGFWADRFKQLAEVSLDESQPGPFPVACHVPSCDSTNPIRAAVAWPGCPEACLGLAKRRASVHS